MSGSEVYQVVRMRKFETSYESLIKHHYKRDKKSRAIFERLLEDFLAELCVNPRPNNADLQAFPANSREEGFEFWKKRWSSLPGLRGAAKFGRLLYVVCEPKRLVYLFWIYTHEEYGEPRSQPPAKDLSREIDSIVEDSKTKVDDADPLISVISVEGDTSISF
ncbi:hypothetical protein H6F43_01095 [Leptolyngbya sp. FACHB-36]|uniref:hypothetical protein n=1 Tax=Leptolyngbya sp. FACHB-36 TaxID=2692808 RepID=UPI00167FFCC2|nr:hypothetical protein [Leptolyngbya sp. FACHB-36]MBD2018779.1 hypothetical protein [Leptolyngbya sp. FACHB-36]